MEQKRFALLNNIGGWLAFTIAAITYLSTMEPTTSLWDCGEFIAASYKLQVVHPPGAPFFLLLNRFFTIFAPNEMWVARFVNAQSAISSALTILFLFWTTSLLARKILKAKFSNLEPIHHWLVLASSLIASLVFTFTDTFWFSAVEGEVYAISTMFMALVFWLILKWENHAEEKDNHKWLILIALLMGISIGIHLLSLLVIPVIGIVYYFKKFEPSRRGVIVTIIVGFVTLGFILQGMIKTIPAIASKIELVFVNSFGLPFWSGIIFSLFLIFSSLIFGIWYSHKKVKPLLNLVLLCITMFFVGYVSYATVVIRSLADPSIDMNNPESVFNLISYLNREQYGDRPLLYGHYFTADRIGTEEGAKKYRAADDEYVFTTYKIIPVYDPEHKSIFPRMSDQRGDRVRAYRQWADIAPGKKPSFSQNLSFFFTYQLGHMYWRYFAWNYVGRQNDEQGFGNFMNGNWLSGISFIDELVAGPQENIPHWQKQNKARNKLFFLPFILGIIGLIFHFNTRKWDAYSVLAFFLMTGFMLVLYLNNPPNEPRERDYTLVGSFYVFAIWIGIGLIAIWNKIRGRLKPNQALLLTFFLTLGVPVLMASQEWDDHDRSNRYTTVEFGKNYLRSCDSNSVLICNADNDTYPLWYAQEVEGFRTDVRVINTQLLMTDWYINQLKSKVNKSEAFTLNLPDEKIVEGKRDYVPFRENQQIVPKGTYVDINQFIDFMLSEDPRTKFRSQGGDEFNYFPTKLISIPVNLSNALKSGILKPSMRDGAVEEIKVNIRKNAIYKSDLAILALIAGSNWERPVNFALTSDNGTYLNMGQHIQQTGLCYRFTPFKGQGDGKEAGSVDVETMYDNLMNNFQWGGLENSDLYIGSVTRRHCRSYRSLFQTLAVELIKQGDNKRATAVVDRCLEVITDGNVPFDYSVIGLMEAYYQANAPEKGMELGKKLFEIFTGDLEYYESLSRGRLISIQREVQNSLYFLQSLKTYASQNQQTELANEADAALQKYNQLMLQRGRAQ